VTPVEFAVRLQALVRRRKQEDLRTAHWVALMLAAHGSVIDTLTDILPGTKGKGKATAARLTTEKAHLREVARARMLAMGIHPDDVDAALTTAPKRSRRAARPADDRDHLRQVAQQRGLLPA
jgi:hydroxypyruvate isomerase